MKGRRVVQSDALTQFGKPDAFAMMGDFLEDGESAAERLDADALPVLRIIVRHSRWRDKR
jgi:hypothetical protein